MPNAHNTTQNPSDNTPQTRSAFMDALFPQELLRPGEMPLVSYPAFFDDAGGHRVNYYKQMYWNKRSRKIDSEEQGWLFCVSTVKVGDKPRRRLTDVREAFVLPCDDIGSKCRDTAGIAILYPRNLTR